MNKPITALLLLSSLISIQACADDRPPPPGEMPSFSDMDTNGDGELQKDELRGPLANDFDRLDTDDSGGLSEDEVPPPPSRERS